MDVIAFLFDFIMLLFLSAYYRIYPINIRTHIHTRMQINFCMFRVGLAQF